MHLVRDVRLLPHQDLILIDPGMMPLIEAVGCIFILGGNHILRRDTLTDLSLEGTLMTLCFMRMMHMG